MFLTPFSWTANQTMGPMSKTKYKEAWYNGGKYKLYMGKILLLKQNTSFLTFRFFKGEPNLLQSIQDLFFHEWHTQFFVISWTKNGICQSLSIFMPSSLRLIIDLQIIIHLRRCVSVWQYKALVKDNADYIDNSLLITIDFRRIC